MAMRERERNHVKLIIAFDAPAQQEQGKLAENIANKLSAFQESVSAAAALPCSLACWRTMQHDMTH